MERGSGGGRDFVVSEQGRPGVVVGVGGSEDVWDTVNEVLMMLVLGWRWRRVGEVG